LLERLEVGREHRVGHTERSADRSSLRVERGAAGGRERLEPGVGDRERGVDESGVDPQAELGIARRVARSVISMEALRRRIRPGSPSRPVHDRQSAQRLAVYATIGAEIEGTP
jgi:hypothetical protein